MEVNWWRETDLAIMEGVNLDQLEVTIPATVRAAVLMADQLRLKQEALTKLLTHFYEVRPQHRKHFGRLQQYTQIILLKG